MFHLLIEENWAFGSDFSVRLDQRVRITDIILYFTWILENSLSIFLTIYNLSVRTKYSCYTNGVKVMIFEVQTFWHPYRSSYWRHEWHGLLNTTPNTNMTVRNIALSSLSLPLHICQESPMPKLPFLCPHHDLRHQFTPVTLPARLAGFSLLNLYLPRDVGWKQSFALLCKKVQIL